MSDTHSKPTHAEDLYTGLRALVLFLLALVVLTTFLVRVIRVDGHSMDPTLQDRELLLLQCAGYEPEQGDIIVLHKDFAHITGPIVKRVIATEGQTVEVDYDAGTVYVDGEALPEPYLGEPMVQPADPTLQETRWTIPEGAVFVLGDNRNFSLDSRHGELGPVDARYILGRAVWVIFPFSQFGAAS